MKHPYENAPGYRRWRHAVAAVPIAEVDPVVSWPYRINRSERIATAGSCFAQHIARHLQANGFSYLVTESAHPLLSAADAASFGYGQYTARYGNVYTARQLLQLIRRAYGRFQPAEDVWEHEGSYYDPFRPAIQPGGFPTFEEYQRDRQQHFAAVRTGFETADVFIFTLGLTECWRARSDGAVFPVCPGTVAGSFDPARHAFLNLSVSEVVADMTQAVTELRTVNPKLKVILTVSPVPLAATAEDRHVLVATSHSKSVLRIAAEELTRLPEVAYFPSYEITTGAFARGAYFAEDLRNIREAGVEHVMRLFFKHVTNVDSPVAITRPETAPSFIADMTAVVDTICEETRLDAD
jgi:hypothetical protein